VRALLWPLFARSAWAEAETVVAGTMFSALLWRLFDFFSVSSTSHSRLGHCPGLRSLGRILLSQPLWWRARKVTVLLWPMFASSAWSQQGIVVASVARSAWAQTATVVAGTRCQWAALASVRLVGVGSASHCGDGYYR
jgi:hypothetical protein